MYYDITGQTRQRTLWKTGLFLKNQYATTWKTRKKDNKNFCLSPGEGLDIQKSMLQYKMFSFYYTYMSAIAFTKLLFVLQLLFVNIITFTSTNTIINNNIAIVGIECL